MSRVLHDLPARQAARDPRAVALWWQDEPMDYGRLHDRVQRLAERLAATGTVGDRVAVLAWNCPAYVELIYAASASGRILVPLNARLAPAELVGQLRATGAGLLFGDRDLLQPLRANDGFPAGTECIALHGEYEAWLGEGPRHPLPQVGGDSAAWILFTSGTTGKPKGAVLTHRSLLAGLRSAALGRPVQAGDRYLYPFPLFHVAAHNVLLQHQFGAAVVLCQRFDAAETLRTCRTLGITTLSLAPTMIAMLLDHPGFDPTDLARVRTIGYGASNIPADLLRLLLAETRVGLCQSYGMTELSGSIAFLTPADHRLAAESRPELLQSVGKPLRTAQVRLVDESGRDCRTGKSGEILVKAEQCRHEYWQDTPATRAVIEDGWLHTGDIGRRDREGYLYIVDRKKDMLISGGENVASREVEAVLRRHPAVKDCAVIGLPDPTWGEVVTAVMVMTVAASDSELDRHCRSCLAGYKTPRHWVRVDALPANAAGKIDKALLRQTTALPRASRVTMDADHESRSSTVSRT